MIDRCTMVPDAWWGDCCGSHDIETRDKSVSWIAANYHLAQCIYASTFSTRITGRFSRPVVITGRYIVPSLYFIGTSTLGWLWRWKATCGA